jgi:hypothetical protein
MPRAAVLGAGINGLLAAYAASRAQLDVVIFSAKESTDHIPGVQFLRMPIPGLSARVREVDVSIRGDIEDYNAKRFEPEFNPALSELPPGRHRLYDLRDVYRQLRGLYYDSVVEREFIRQRFRAESLSLLDDFDIVFNTIPASYLCNNPEHTFKFQQCYRISDGPDTRCPVRIPESTIEYNATRETAWFRAANVFDHCTAEWPATSGRRRPPFQGLETVEIPISNNCSCYPGLVRVGPRSVWTHYYDAHDSFVSATNYLRGRGVQASLF